MRLCGNETRTENEKPKLAGNNNGKVCICDLSILHTVNINATMGL